MGSFLRSSTITGQDLKTDMADGMNHQKTIRMSSGYANVTGLHQYSIISASLYLLDTVLKFYRHDLILKGWREYICYISDTNKKARLLFENAQQDLLDLLLTENCKGSTDIRISVKLKGAANRVVLNFQLGEMFYDESAGAGIAPGFDLGVKLEEDGIPGRPRFQLKLLKRK